MQIDPGRLVQARTDRAMSQEEAAIATDLSARTIQRIEAGHPAALESTKALLTIFGSDIIHDPEAEVAVTMAHSPWLAYAERIGSASQSIAQFSFAGLRLLFAAVFLLIGLAKPFAPDRAGLFVRGNETTLGLLNHAPIGAQELLGYWIMPTMLIAAVALLFSIAAVRRLVWPQFQS